MNRAKRRRMIGAVAAGLWLAAAGTWADTAIVDGVEWTYTASGGTAVVTGADPATGTLSIPSELGGCTVTGIGEWALAWKDGLSSVTIAPDVTEIADYAFRSCANLTTLVLGNKVESIGEYAFADCNKLPTLKLPASVAAIGAGAFSGCDQLASLEVPFEWEGTSILVGTGLPAGCDVVYGGRFTVTLDRQGGTGGSASVAAIYRRAMPSIRVPSRTGYVFGGYYTGKNGTGTQYYTEGGAGTRNWDRTSGATLYAKWTAASTVTLDRQGGSGGTASVTAIYGRSMPSINVPTRAGHIFGGYHNGRNGTGTQYYTAGGVGTKNWDRTGAVTLYAKWTAVSTVTLDRQNGTGGTTNVTATYGRAMPTISIPERTGCVFGGYYTGQNGTGTQYYTASGASARTWNRTGAATLYAKWTTAGPLTRGSYYDIDSPYWDVDYGTPAQPLLHSAYAAATGGTNITWTVGAQGVRTAWVPGSKDPGILQRAVNEARPGDTIKVAPGSYSPVTVSKDRISIVSTKGRFSTYINALFATRCVNFGSTKGGKIEGFTLVQGSAGQGGGIYGGSAVHCLIEGCRANYGGGAAQSALTDCIVSWNTAANAGGGAYGGTLLRCEVRHNAADIGGGGVAVTATCSLFAGNQAEVQSGGAERSSLVACTVVDNRAPAAAGVYSSAVKNSILQGNRLSSGATNNYAVSTCQYTCAWPVPPGTGNFNAVPNFVDQANENYHLNNYSKCRDKGNKNLSGTRYDLSGLDRVMGANVDVGCYEYATGVTPLDPADYDGDGQPDVGFFNPKNGTWFLKQTTDGTVRRVVLGNTSSTLVPRDYDGDGIRDPAVYDPNTGTWKILQSHTKSVASKKLGWKGITLVDATDYDGDGKADPIIFNPASKTWQILQSRNGSTAVVKNFGGNGIRLFCGDYDGDGYGDLGYYAASNQRWYVRFRNGSVRWMQLGQSGVRPCPVDFDRDGALDPGYFAPSTGKWTVRSFVTGSTSTTKFGDATTTPHPFDWNNDGIPDTLGTYSPYRAGFLDLYRNPNGTRTAYTTNF